MKIKWRQWKIIMTAVLAVIAVVGAVAITLGITLRKKKNAAEEKKQTEE